MAGLPKCSKHLFCLCCRTYSFLALIVLLRSPPEQLHQHGQDMLTKFSDLVVKCLIKLTKALQTTLHVSENALMPKKAQRAQSVLYHALGDSCAMFVVLSPQAACLLRTSTVNVFLASQQSQAQQQLLHL